MARNSDDNFTIVDDYVEPELTSRETNEAVTPPLEESHEAETDRMFRELMREEGVSDTVTNRVLDVLSPIHEDGAINVNVDNEDIDEESEDSDDYEDEEETSTVVQSEEDIMDSREWDAESDLPDIDSVEITTETLAPQPIDLSSVAAAKTRFKGAEWFSIMNKMLIMIIGQGGIGSWLTLFLGRIGCELYTFDMDTFEEHNMSGQFVKHKAIGKSKAEAVKELVRELAGEPVIHTMNERYTSTSITNPVVVCGFDNMEGRRTAFERWRRHVERLDTVQRGACLFMDGRLNAENYQIFAIQGWDTTSMDKYDKEYLFVDSAVEEQDCTFKQTSHCAAMIASMMTTILTNWACSTYGTSTFRNVPFYTEFSAPILYFQVD